MSFLQHLNILYLHGVLVYATMYSYASTRAESVGYCVTQSTSRPLMILALTYWLSIFATYLYDAV